MCVIQNRLIQYSSNFVIFMAWKVVGNNRPDPVP